MLARVQRYTRMIRRGVNPGLPRLGRTQHFGPLSSTRRHGQYPMKCCTACCWVEQPSDVVRSRRARKITRARARMLTDVRMALKLSVERRSRRKIYDKKKAARTGVKKQVGSHLDGPRERQCDRCDKDKHRRCARLPHCKARARSPAGINKREQGAARARARIRTRTGDRDTLCARTDLAHAVLARRKSCSA